MSDTKISEAAVEAGALALSKYCRGSEVAWEEDRCSFRAALAAALPHLHQQPAFQLAGSEPLWCLHVLGMDDVHPAPPKAHAEKAAAWHNEQFKEQAARIGITVEAVVAPWPHSAESHAAGVADFIPEWLIPQWQLDALESKAAPPAQGIDLAQPAPSVTRYRIEDAPGLDPVTVYVENYAPGKGRMVVTCYASAWTAFWGAMGDDTTLEQFVASCSPEYVADNMVWGADTKKSTKGYADKVAAAVVAFFKRQRDAAPEVGNG